jgi:hypothetical protein
VPCFTFRSLHVSIHVSLNAKKDISAARLKVILPASIVRHQILASLTSVGLILDGRRGVTPVTGCVTCRDSFAFSVSNAAE